MALTIPCIIVFLFLLFHLAHLSAQQVNNNSEKCPQFVCGNLTGIRFPFFNINTSNCGFYGINCEDNIPKIKFEEKTFIVKNISYEEKRVVIQDSELWNLTKSKICDFPTNFSLPEFPRLQIRRSRNLTVYYCKHNQYTVPGNISEEVRNYTDCEGKDLYYTKNNTVTRQNLLPKNCSTVVLPVFQFWKVWKRNDFLSIFAAGFALEWDIDPKCEDCYKRGGNCTVDERTKIFRCQVAVAGQQHKRNIKKIIIGVTAGIGSFLLAWILFFLSFRKKGRNNVRKWRKSNAHNVEAFLKNYGSLAPQRYSYSDIKKMTSSFIDKLGQGGFGAVFKGKLQDGRLVAVKILSESKGNGEEFINEVASIGKTYHVNIVSLLGFCAEGSKRALVYEFMPNGSLEKFIYTEKSRQTDPLGWEILYQIAVGIAQGLEYLHRGCSTRILHFDIKPHNILLDQDFLPKISDFGLAKLCPNKDSIISTLDGRGTVGYIAPEVFCRNIGRASHKSDVYSYGMMMLEIVGRRKNVDDRVEKTSEIYFPHWIFMRLDINDDLGLHGVTTEEEEKTARKMILVGLWCIQTDPANRPSMNRVLEMLEGTLESLQMPPKPFLSSPKRSSHDSCTTSMIITEGSP
ncbi:LEAF RUST 10 DISEASE-RESISTANCE LOCUS RECEPTOR-LIKE PROTEIN KINASE-like 2.5 isoform X2 [Tasmannia lanceolata]|uniref:LEAF RUST 10 DISEASE-RESISTANCE LOCUS RECEPTOR-LIKE PROTEIN KINASE-like 2.5 isoform X2 n=1 Tax=Tasmannia lanceolata TaxID=3420 RepID=UPI004062CC71